MKYAFFKIIPFIILVSFFIINLIYSIKKNTSITFISIIFLLGILWIEYIDKREVRNKESLNSSDAGKHPNSHPINKKS